ncbi:MAG: hypothetical protein H7246_19865 [Phycisphaerae bacterium]|nr:hypothetical protein [Saprospiraceae bacterium]
MPTPLAISSHLYRLLAVRHPTIGSLVGLAAVLVESGDAVQAASVLQSLVAADVEIYQPYWATLAKTLFATGDSIAAQKALNTAIELTKDKAVRAFLLESARNAP